MKIITTGVSSGLGRYIYENMGGIGLTRDTSRQYIEHIKDGVTDVIIHCAFNSKREIDSQSLYGYLEDNVLLTKNLASLPHLKFIFVSSVDVYPKDGNPHSEGEVIEVGSVGGIYGVTKLMSESIIRKHCSNYLILRASAFLGSHTRRHSLIRILEDHDCVLSLSGESVLNYVLHSDILDFMQLSIHNDLRGTFNVTSSKNITLYQVAQAIGRKVEFGNYSYDVGSIDNGKISSIFPPCQKTSREIISQYLKERCG